MKFTKKKENQLEEEINHAFERLKELDPTLDDYGVVAENLKVLYEIKGEDVFKPLGISPEKWAAIAANLLGIVMILKYEEVRVVTSKALGFILKGRV